jgi:serine/threonine protein kinase/tetratricopeptide (TPR) repeat protein
MNERSIFMEALDFDEPREQAAYIERACGGDERLRARVEALIRRHHATDQLALDRVPAVDRAVTEELARPDEEPGASIGPYKLREQIGEGGMGMVYVAEQTQPVRRKVALKIIKPGMDTRQVVARFEAERQALAMMDHPNIARVFDGGTTPTGRPYFAMELVRGIPITEYCDDQKLAISARLELFVLVCRAVQHAHQKGIIHRDLKPSNILITLHDGVPVPKVIDFGVAKATGQTLTDKTVYTAFTQLVGTPLYMSPEQVELSGLDIDTRSDIYSLGVLLYELLTGTTPFDAETLRNAAFDEMRRIIREQEPQSPSARLSSLGETLPTVSARRGMDARRLGPSLRGELDWIVMKALEKDRRRRYETASDFASDVIRYVTDQPVEACPPSVGYRMRKFVRRNKGPVAAGVALASLLVLGTVGTSIGLVWARQAETKAKQAEAHAKEEADVANAVWNFLADDLLGQASPAKNARNKRVTVEELLGRAAGRIAGKFAQRPRVEAEIRLTIGSAFEALGDFTAAQPQLERAWEIVRRVLGEEDPRTLTFMNNLACLYTDEGEYPNAESLHIKALEVRRRVLGNEDPDTLASMNNLGVLYRAQGKPAQAEPLFVKALEGRRRVLGEEHPDTLVSVNNVATVYMDQGKFAQAEPILVDALGVGRRVLGEEQPETLKFISNLAMVYEGQGKFAQAEPLLVRALEGRRRVLGEEHPDTLQNTGNLATVYQDQEKLAQAEPLFVKALEGMRRVLGEEHPDTLKSMNNLAWLYRNQGKVAQAEPLFVKALEVGRRVVGEEHPDTLLFMRNLARVYEDQGKLAQAEPLFVKALEGCRRVLGEERPDTLDATLSLAMLWAHTGKPAEAEPVFVRVLEVSRRVLGEEHPMTLNALNHLAGHYSRSDPAKALPMLVKVLEVSRRVLGEGHPQTLANMNNLACFYRDHGKLVEAELLFVKALEGTRRVQREEHSYALNIMNNLAELYEKQGDLTKAEALMLKALEVGRRVLGEEHPGTLRSMTNLGALYADHDELTKAEPFTVLALEIARRIFGEAHPEALTAASNLAQLFWLNRKFDRSIPLYEDVLNGRRVKLGPDHPDTLTTMAHLGVTYRDAGRLPEGTDLLEQAWANALKQPVFPIGDLAWMSIELGKAYEKAGQFAKAESVYREMLETVRQQHKEASSHSTDLQYFLAMNLLKHRRCAEAEPLLRECLKFREQNETDHWKTFATKSLLGGGLLGQQKYAEAEPLLLAGYEGMKRRERKIQPIFKFRLTEAIERLVQLYEAWGQPEKAAEWRAKLPPAAPELPADVFARPQAALR